MKKALFFIMSSIVAMTTMAKEQQSAVTDANIRGVLLELSDPHEPPFDENDEPTGLDRIVVLQNYIDNTKIPLERMARILEDMIRERLPLLEKLPDDPARVEYGNNPIFVYNLINKLKVCHGTNTLALLKECAMCEDSNIRRNAAESYIYVTQGGDDGIQFLRDFFAKENTPDSDKYYLIHWGLKNGVIKRLKEKNKTDEVMKLEAFIREVETGKIVEDEKLPVKKDAPIAPPPTIEAPEKPATEPDAQSPSRTWLWVIGVCVVIIGGMAVRRKKP